MVESIYLIYGYVHDFVGQHFYEVRAITEDGRVLARELVTGEEQAKLVLGMCPESTRLHDRYLRHSPFGKRVFLIWVKFDATDTHIGLSIALRRSKTSDNTRIN